MNISLEKTAARYVLYGVYIKTAACANKSSSRTAFEWLWPEETDKPTPHTLASRAAALNTPFASGALS